MEIVISFEETRIVYVKGKTTAKGFNIVSLREEPLSLEQQQSVTVNPAEYAEALSTLVNRSTLKGKKVEVLIEPKGSILREILIPPSTPPAQTEAILQSEMQFYYSNINEYVTDYLLTKRKAEDGRAAYLVYAIKQDYIEGILELLTAVGVKCKSMTLSNIALTYLLHHTIPNTSGFLALDISALGTSLVLSEKEQVVLMRKLGVGHQHFAGKPNLLADEMMDQVNSTARFNQTRHRNRHFPPIAIIGSFTGREEFLTHLVQQVDASSLDVPSCSAFSLEGKITTTVTPLEPFESYGKAIGGLALNK